MIISTGYIEHSNIRAYLGVVSASCVTGIGFARDTMAAFKDFTGGRVSGYEEAMQQANNEAIASLTKQATALGADAIMGIRVSATVFSPGGKGTVMGVIAYGTAVKLKQLDAHHIERPEHKSFVNDETEPVRTHTVPDGVGFDWGR